MRDKREPVYHEVSIERDGKSHVGYYFVDRKMITVAHVMLGRKSALVGASPPDTLAKIMLGELVREHERS